MQVVINVTDIKIIAWKVDVERQCVIVDFQMMQDNGNAYERKEAIFWVSIPENPVDRFGNPITDTSLWFQLPLSYVETLTNITIDARAALLHLVQ